MKIYHLAILAVFVLACKDVKEKNQHSEKETKSEVNIVLNNGEKWKVNNEMIPFIKASDDLLSAYVENNDEDYKNLAEGLKENNNNLISSCTMKGTAHDELHKWLHPHLQLVEKLKKAESPEKSAEIVKQLQSSFQAFNTYFQ